MALRGLAAVAWLTALAGTVSEQVHAAASTGSQASIRYRANFSGGLRGWTQSTSGNMRWQTIGGQAVISASGKDTSQIVAPASVRNQPNFSISASIQFGGPWSYFQCFGLVARSVPGVFQNDQSYSGILAGACRDREHGTDWHYSAGIGYSCNTCYDEHQISYFAQNYFPLDNAWHTYKLIVRANRYRLNIDGQQVAAGTSNAFLGGTSVGLFSQGSSVSVRSFKLTIP